MGGQGPRVRQIPGFAVDFASILGACAEKLISLTPSTPCAPSPLCLQKIRLPRRAKHRQISAHPVHQEGRIMIATNAGQDAVAAGLLAWRARDERTVKPCGPVPPMLGTSLPKQFAGDGG
jgi:hypothetical protein